MDMIELIRALKNAYVFIYILDRVGAVDNRPSTD